MPDVVDWQGISASIKGATTCPWSLHTVQLLAAGLGTTGNRATTDNRTVTMNQSETPNRSASPAHGCRTALRWAIHRQCTTEDPLPGGI